MHRDTDTLHLIYLSHDCAARRDSGEGESSCGEVIPAPRPLSAPLRDDGDTSRSNNSDGGPNIASQPLLSGVSIGKKVTTNLGKERIALGLDLPCNAIYATSVRRKLFSTRHERTTDTRRKHCPEAQGRVLVHSPESSALRRTSSPGEMPPPDSAP